MFRRKYVKQDTMKDCGPACLLMIMRHYGGNYPLEQLRKMVNMDKNGTTAFDLIETAKRMGFDARGYKCEMFENIKCPSIAHVVIDKMYHHFVVIRKVDIRNKKIIVADPAFGLKNYSFEEFNKIWSHTIITFYPIKKIENISTFKNAKKTILQIIKPHTKFFVLILFMSIVGTILNILNTFYFKIIIDNASLLSNPSYYMFLIFLIIVVIKNIVEFLRFKLMADIDTKIDLNLIENTFKHLLSLPWQYFNSRTTGDIISRINDLSYVRDLISRVSTILLVDLVLIIGSMVFMLLISKVMFFITLIILFLYFLIVYLFSSRIDSYVMKNQENEAMVSTSFIETISGIKTIKNLCIEKEMHQKVMNKYNLLVNHNYQFVKKYDMAKMIKELILSGGLIIIIFVSSILITSGRLSVGNFIIFIYFFNYFIEPLKNILEAEPLLKSSTNALIRLSEFYDIEKDLIKDKKIMQKGTIYISNPTYSYNQNKIDFSNLNISIEPGEKVMISGPSGAGKSTLAKMIMRYLEIDNNQIYVDGEDINNYSISSIRENICYVSQEEQIFSDSLYNNIVLDRKINEKLLMKIIKISNVEEIPKKHNLDWNMLIEENGSNLSGGERQRIMIARALLKNCKIYIFDESMSEMDVILERTITENIFKYYEDKTIIVISHRLNNTDLYDRVLNIANFNRKEEREVIM